jgi:hypothetical protein
LRPRENLAALVQPDEAARRGAQAEFAIERRLAVAMRRQGQLAIDEVIGMNAGREGTPGRKLTAQVDPRRRKAARPLDAVGVEVPAIGGVASRRERLGQPQRLLCAGRNRHGTSLANHRVRREALARPQRRDARG